MGEYYLKCEPIETKPELKEVLKFLDNPLFTNSIINSGFKKYIILLACLIITTFLGYKTYNNLIDNLNGKKKSLGGYGFLTIASLIVTIMFFSDIIQI